MSTVLMNREDARSDLRDASIRVMEDRVFSVSRPPLNSAALATAWVTSELLWSEVPRDGSCPLLREDWDVIGVEVIRAAHDYPDADLLGHYIAD